MIAGDLSHEDSSCAQLSATAPANPDGAESPVEDLTVTIPPRDTRLALRRLRVVTSYCGDS